MANGKSCFGFYVEPVFNSAWSSIYTNLPRQWCNENVMQQQQQQQHEHHKVGKFANVLNSKQQTESQKQLRKKERNTVGSQQIHMHGSGGWLVPVLMLLLCCLLFGKSVHFYEYYNKPLFGMLIQADRLEWIYGLCVENEHIHICTQAGGSPTATSTSAHA